MGLIAEIGRFREVFSGRKDDVDTRNVPTGEEAEIFNRARPIERVSLVDSFLEWGGVEEVGGIED
jgi:hypothetical protein